MKNPTMNMMPLPQRLAISKTKQMSKMAKDTAYDKKKKIKEGSKKDTNWDKKMGVKD